MDDIVKPSILEFLEQQKSVEVRNFVKSNELEDQIAKYKLKQEKLRTIVQYRNLHPSELGLSGKKKKKSSKSER